MAIFKNTGLEKDPDKPVSFVTLSCVLTVFLNLGQFFSIYLLTSASLKNIGWSLFRVSFDLVFSEFFLFSFPPALLM